ncbi:MAG: arsenic efflux protein [Gemmatimonadota bacterium]|nr:MAG: arsenic efflux protein [Gemmatimonadota bacterium]
MTAALWEAVTQAVMITAFVAMMMITVEYLSVLSRGAFQNALFGSRWLQYLAAVVLGAIPGCLGPFTVVALYAHRVVPIGAVVGAMIATSGDESFVMFSLFPGTALLLTLGLAALGLVVGPLVDLFLRDLSVREPCPELVIHEEEGCRCFPGREIVEQWRRLSRARGVLTTAIAIYLAAVGVGLLGPPEWNWVRVTLSLVGLFGGFVVSTVPDHFLADHLWKHIAVRHVPRVFAWTLGVLVGVAILSQFVDLVSVVRENPWTILGLAVLLGLIPESGPHLIFVTLFSQGAIPFSVLGANSIVQDGHGMLPLLAESRRDFLLVKAVKLVVGLGLGAAVLWGGL